MTYVFQRISHCPGRYYLPSVLCEILFHAVCVLLRAEVERCDSEKVECMRNCSYRCYISIRIFCFLQWLYKTFCDFRKGKSGAVRIIMHPVCRDCKCRDSCLCLNYLCQCRKIRAIHKRNRRACQRNKFRMQFFCRLLNVTDKFCIVPHHSIDLSQPGNVDQAVLFVPADLIVGIVSRITSGRIVHDYHAAKLVECGTHSGNIRCINRYDSI